MASDLKSVQMAKAESERKRKQAEQQLAELSIRLQEMEQSRAETTEKAIKLAQELEQVSRCCLAGSGFSFKCFLFVVVFFWGGGGGLFLIVRIGLFN